MPEACPSNPPTSRPSEPGPQCLAFCIVRAKYSQPFSSGHRQQEVCVSSSRLFHKWVEVEALANIRDIDVTKFMWKNNITRFGVPDSLILDNRLQFNSKAFCKFCSDLGIRNKYSTLAYPQSNGQAEATNKAIINGLQKRLDGVKGRWAEELPSILWVYRMTPRRSTRETPFSLMYRAEAMIPAEVSLCSTRVEKFTPALNNGLIVEHLDLLEEFREMATIRLAEYQQKLAQRYNRCVRAKDFSVGDLVLRKVVGHVRDTNAGKLDPTWEGPYRVTTIAGVEAYYLEDLDERPLP